MFGLCGAAPLGARKVGLFRMQRRETSVTNGQADGFTDVQLQQGQRRKCLACVRLKRHSVVCNVCGELLPRRRQNGNSKRMQFALIAAQNATASFAMYAVSCFPEVVSQNGN